MKHFLKKIIPPIILQFLKTKRKFGILGDYKNWEDALQASGSYFNDPLAIQSYHHQIESRACQNINIWPIISGILLAANQCGNNLRILDFGGGVGTTYFQIKRILPPTTKITYTVLDLPEVVSYARTHLSNNEINFIEKLDESYACDEFNILLCCGVLMYLEKPYDSLRELLFFNFDYVFLDRTPIMSNNNEKIMVQRLPPDLGGNANPLRLLSSNKITEIFHNDYELIAEHSWGRFPSIDSPHADYKCLLYKKKVLLGSVKNASR